MWVDRSEVDLACNQAQHSAYSFEVRVAASTSFGGLKRAVVGFQEPVGLTRLGSGNNGRQLLADHTGDVLHRLDLRARHVRAPLFKHRADNVDLFAIKDVAQLLAIQPRTCSAFGRDIGYQRVEVGALRRVQPVAILEQRPSKALEIRAILLFEPAGFLQCSRGLSDNVEFVESESGVR